MPSNWDGMVTTFRFLGGHVDFKSRYVRTPRFMAEREARHALFGSYRDPCTDDPKVAGISRGLANTNVHFHGGRLLASKEDRLPIEIDPDTLGTIGEIDWDGAVSSLTATAHPKIDPVTGGLVLLGYAAKGEATPVIAYYEADATGKVVDEAWLEAPYPAKVHDWVVTEHFVVFPLTARHGPRACEGRRRRLRVGRISRWLSRGAPAQGRRRRDPLAPQHEPVRRPCDERVRRRAARARRHARRHDEPVPVLPRRHRLAVRPEGVAGLPVPMDRRHRGRRVVRGGPTGRRAGGALAHGRPLRHETVPVRPAVAHRRPRGRPLRAADRGLPVHRRGDPRDGLLPRLLPGRPDGAAGAVLRHAPCHGRRGRRVRARRRGAARGDAQQPLVLDASDPGGGPVATLALPFRLRYGLRGSWVAAATLAGRKGTVPTTGKGAS